MNQSSCPCCRMHQCVSGCVQEDQTAAGHIHQLRQNLTCDDGKQSSAESPETPRNTTSKAEEGEEKVNAEVKQPGQLERGAR